MDGILLVMNFNDFFRSLARNLYVYDNETLIASQRWRQRGIKTFLDDSKIYKFLQENFHIFSGIQRFFWRWYFQDLTHNFDPKKTLVQIPEPEAFDEDSDYIVSLSYQLLSKLKRLADSKNIPVWITTTGFLVQDRLTIYDSNAYSSLDSLTQQLHLPYHDITPKLIERIDNDFSKIEIEGDDHPNPEGSVYISNLIYENIGQKIIKYYSQ